MLKVDKLVKSNKDLDIKLKQEYIKALEDKKFKEFIECIKIDDELLIKYTSRLKEASLEFHHCLNCKGLGECKNKVKGFALVPSKDNNRVSFIYKSCNYKNKESYKENVELFDVPYAIKNASLKDLYKDKNRIELIKKMKSYLVLQNF